MKKTHIKITSIILALLLFVTVFGLSACGPEDTEETEVQDVIMAVGSSSTTSSVYGKSMVSWLKECYKDDDSVKFRTKANANDITNMRKLISGDVSFAVMPGDIAYFAKKGTMYFDSPADHITMVAELCSIGCQLIASNDSNITSVSDLCGKKVAAGDEGSAARHLFDIIAEACGISGQVELVDMKYSDSVTALEEGEIDAIFAEGDAPFKRILELAVTKGIRLIDLDEDICKKLSEENEYMVCITVPEQTYYGQQEAVNTIGIKMYLLKNDTLISDDFSKDITDYIEEGLETITENCEKATGFKLLAKNQ